MGFPWGKGGGAFSGIEAQKPADCRTGSIEAEPRRWYGGWWSGQRSPQSCRTRAGSGAIVKRRVILPPGVLRRPSRYILRAYMCIIQWLVPLMIGWNPSFCWVVGVPLVWIWSSETTGGRAVSHQTVCAYTCRRARERMTGSKRAGTTSRIAARAVLPRVASCCNQHA